MKFQRISSGRIEVSGPDWWGIYDMQDKRDRANPREIRRHLRRAGRRILRAQAKR